jgi:hypothetical protein
MKYILDFDHTLYETARFKEDARAYDALETWATPAIWDSLDERSYFYNDTIPFLLTLNRCDVVILTAVSPELGVHARAFQEAKLKKSGIAPFVHEILFMEGDKGPYVEQLYEGTPTVFLDDTLAHLESAKAHCPGVYTVQMVRPGLEHRGPISASSAIPVLSSLEPLKELFL